MSAADRDRRRVLEMADAGDAARLGAVLADPARDELARATAAASLGTLPDGASQREPLLKAFEDPSALVRRDAAESAGVLRLADAAPPLARLLQDPDVDVRRASARALGRLADPAAVDPLVAALRDRDPGVVVLSAEALHRITGENLGTDRKAWEAWAASRTK